MSFRFKNPEKIRALEAAGFKGRVTSWAIHLNNCPCCESPDFSGHGKVFDPPPGVSISKHDKAIDLALWGAGFSTPPHRRLW